MIKLYFNAHCYPLMIKKSNERVNGVTSKAKLRILSFNVLSFFCMQKYFLFKLFRFIGTAARNNEAKNFKKAFLESVLLQGTES